MIEDSSEIGVVRDGIVHVSLSMDYSGVNEYEGVEFAVAVAVDEVGGDAGAAYMGFRARLGRPADTLHVMAHGYEYA